MTPNIRVSDSPPITEFDWDAILDQECPLWGETRGNVHLIHLRDEFSLEQVAEIRDTLRMIEREIDWGSFAFDLSDLPIIPTTLIGTLIEMTKHLTDEGRYLCLLNPNEITDHTLRTLNLHKVFPILPDEDSLVANSVEPF